MTRTPVLTAAVLAGLGLGASTFPAAAAVGDGTFRAEQSATVDKNAGTATFRLSFDRLPRFFLPDGGSEQLDAFQIEVDADKNTFEQPIQFDEIDAVVRGAEIFAGGGGIPIRAREGGDGGGASGGWGEVRAVVPFELNGATLTFTTTLDALGDVDGRFRYRLITIEEGGVTSEVNAAIIPLPAALWTGMMLLGGAGALHKLRKRRFC